MCHLQKPSGRLFMFIRKSNGPKIELCGTPGNTDEKFEHWPLSTLVCMSILPIYCSIDYHSYHYCAILSCDLLNM